MARQDTLVSRAKGEMRAFWSALDAAAGPVSTLATLAALVRTLSPPDYGILVMALAASGVSMAINAAIAATTTKFVSESNARAVTSDGAVAQVITVSLIAVLAIDLILIFFVAVFNDSLCRWVFGPDITHARPVGVLLMLAVLALGIQQADMVLAAAIRGLERFGRQAGLEIASRFILAAVLAYIAWRFRSVDAVLIGQCIVCLISLLVRSFSLRWLLPQRQLFAFPGWEQTATLVRYGGWMWASALAGVAYTSADRIMIGQTLGPTAAGQYNIYVQITQLVHFVPTSVYGFSLPVFSRLATQRRDGELARAYNAYSLRTCTLALVVGVGIIIFWPVLLQILAGAGVVASRGGPVTYLTLNFLLLAANISAYHLLLALGKARQVSAIVTGSMLVALLLMAILIPRMGLQGAAVARLSYGLGALILVVAAARALKRRVAQA